jgi:hypothetical protein
LLSSSNFAFALSWSKKRQTPLPNQTFPSALLNLTSALVVREGASNEDSYSFSVTISFPLLDWFDDSLRHPEHFVDFAVDLLRLAVAADCQAGFSLGTGQADGEHLMGGKLLAEGGPRSVYAGVQERSLMQTSR